MGRRLRNTLVPLLLLAAAGCALPPPSPPVSVLAPPKGAEAPRRYRKVAVLPFPAGTEYPAASAEWFAHVLGQGGRVEVVTPGRAELLLRDASFPWPPAEPSPETYRRAATLLGAEALVLGGVTRGSGFTVRFEARLRVVDGGTGEAVHEETVSPRVGFGFSDHPFLKAAVAEAAETLAERLAGTAPAGTRDRGKETAP